MSKVSPIQVTPESTLDADFVLLCRSIEAKRPRTVIEHILKHGIITNEDLKDIYGYDHPPRAIRDVRDNGIPLITHSIKSPKTGRRVGAYTFDNIKNVKHGRIGGRKAFSKKFKTELLSKYGARDAFTGEQLDERYLQIDHRIPYEMSGDGNNLDVAEYMLLDGSSQRAKSWSCEHCENMLTLRNPDICRACFWASPEKYEHIAMRKSRRTDIVWGEDEMAQFEKMRANAEQEGISIAEWIKRRLAEQ